MPHFSRNQQQILGIFSLVYGICLLIFLVQDTSGSITVSELHQADPPDLFSYLDPPLNVNLADLLELQLFHLKVTNQAILLFIDQLLKMTLA